MKALPSSSRFTSNSSSWQTFDFCRKSSRVVPIRCQARTIKTTAQRHADEESRTAQFPPQSRFPRQPMSVSQNSPAKAASRSTSQSSQNVAESLMQLFGEESKPAAPLPKPESPYERVKQLAGESALSQLGKETTQHQREIQRLAARRWVPGDVYSPQDLSSFEMKKHRRKQRPTRDVFDALGIDPVDEWKNPVMMAEFMTTMGRIKHPNETGLRPANQRKIAKAIRRAVGMGFMPSCHVHPEMLRRDGPPNMTNFRWE